MADEEEFRCGSTFGQSFEADLEIIYSKYCRPFDEEEILLSAYADTDDKTFEELFTDIAEDYDSDSEYDSDTSGITSRVNTSQDSLSELDEESSQSSSVTETINRRRGCNLTAGSENLDCNEDFPIPIAESTRRESDLEALDVLQYTCDSEGICKSPAEKDKSTEAVIRTSLYSPTKPSGITSRLSVDNQVRNQLHINKVDTTATPGSHDLAKIVFQARNRIASALVDAFKSCNSSQKRTRVHHKQKKNTNLLSVRWAPALPTAPKKSIKQLSGDSSDILPENCNVPSVGWPVQPPYLKERIIVKSRIRIDEDPNSDLLTIRCSPKSVESLCDIKLPKRKQSIVLPTNRAIKSFQSCDQEQRLNSIAVKRPALNNPGVGAVKHSVKLPTLISPTSSQAFTPNMQIRGITGRRDAEHSPGGPLGISDTQRKRGNSTDMDAVIRKDVILSANCPALQKGSCVSFAKAISTASNTRANGKMTANVGKPKVELACKLTSTVFSCNQNGRKSSASGNGSDATDKETGNKDKRKLATNRSSRKPSRGSELLPSTGSIFTFERHEKLVEQSDMLSELLLVGRCRTPSGPLSRGNEKVLKQCLSDIAAATSNKCLQSESTVSTTTYQNSKAKLVTLRKKDSKSNAKKTGSTGLIKTAVSLTTSGKLSDTDNSAHLLTTSPFKKTSTSNKGKTSKSVIRPSQVGHQTTHLTVHKAPRVSKSNSRKRSADSEICGAAYRVSKKVCVTGDKAGFPNDRNDVAAQLQCRGPGKCRKSFCFKCCHLSG